MKIADVSLIQRIVVTIALLIGVTLVAGGFTAWSIQGIRQQAHQMIDADMAQLERMAVIQQHLLKMRRAEKDISIDLLMKMARVPQRIAEWRHHASEAGQQLQAAVDNEHDPDLQQMLKDGLAKHAEYAGLLAVTIRKIEQQEILDQAIFEMDIEKPVQLAQDAELQISQAIARNRDLTMHGGSGINETLNQLTWMVRIGLLVAAVSGIALGMKLLSSIRQPLAQLTGGIERVKAGDLSLAVVVHAHDELGQMSSDFNDMIDSLKSMVAEVRLAADSITGASSQIASGNLDLSIRTEQAAASLQQATASLETLTGTVQQTADSARDASAIACAAAASADQVGELVLKVVGSMEGIKASSRRIADITTVIDGIAFQTNILALNAAVEAARAGEQGRGFAVVAGEVRLLAQRSAEAAREIKALIEASRDEVESGSRLVQEAGSAMSQIVQQVAEVSHVIQAITRDARIQSSQIGGVNQSMGQLEQMTQQNAALVEQAAAASASLRDQADRMADVMRMFTVSREHQLVLLAA